MNQSAMTHGSHPESSLKGELVILFFLIFDLTKFWMGTEQLSRRYMLQLYLSL